MTLCDADRPFLHRVQGVLNDNIDKSTIIHDFRNCQIGKPTATAGKSDSPTLTDWFAPLSSRDDDIVYLLLDKTASH